MKNNIEKIKKESKEFQQEIRQRTLGYILTALGLVAGLAWNDAIKGIIGYFIPKNGNNVLAQLIYAVLITFAVVIVSIYLTRLVNLKKNK